MPPKVLHDLQKHPDDLKILNPPNESKFKDVYKVQLLLLLFVCSLIQPAVDRLKLLFSWIDYECEENILKTLHVSCI